MQNKPDPRMYRLACSIWGSFVFDVREAMIVWHARDFNDLPSMVQEQLIIDFELAYAEAYTVRGMAEKKWKRKPAWWKW